MKIKAEYRIFLLSFAGAVLLWFLDAVIDSVVFHESFKESFFDFSGHEIYFRLFVTVGLVTFGLIINRVQKRQRAVEDRYKNIVELTTDIIYVADREGNQVFWNDAAYRILGRTPEEIIGKSFLLSIHPDDRADSLEKRKQLINSKVDVLNNIENRYVTKSGKVIYFSHNIRVLRDEAGNVIGTQGIGRDISERKETEQAIRAAMIWAEDEKARSESILSAIGDGISIIDTDFIIQYQNEVHRDTIGGDKRGLTCYRTYAREEAVCPGCPIAETFKDGQIHILEKTVQLNGDSRTLEIKSSPLKDSSGKIIAGIEAVRDITSRKKANEKLKLYSEAIEAAMDGIQIVQLDGTVLYSNKAVEEIYGFTPAQLAGRNVNEMNADREFAGRVIIPRLREHGRWNGEVMVLHKDGTSFPIWLATSLVRDEQGKPIAMIGIIRDITERKQAEEILKRHHEQLMKLVEERTGELSGANEKLRREIADRERMEQELLKAQKLESLGILAGGIAHDFNNLLASIMGNISLALLDLDPSNSAARQLDAAERASLRAQDLTRQLLTFSKGGTPVKRTTVISELIRESAGFALRGSRVRYDFSFPDDLWLVDVDEGQISQVINNLVINADHAMPEGGTITISCENVALTEPVGIPLRSGDYVKVCVEDFGVGIAKEHLSKIFDPYFTTKQKGSGLGLATTYSIIKKHGGHILAESELGRGTTFIIYLPASRTATAPKKTADSRVLVGTGKILLMDDEADVRQTTGDVLKRLGYSVEFAEDGAQAIELYHAARQAGAPFHAVIMDLTVPGGMGGREAVAKLIKSDPAVKAIVSSGYSNDPIMSDFRNYGFMGVVTKPYRIRDLGETLHNVLVTDKERGTESNS